MVASSLKLMAPPANLPLGIRSLIATHPTSCSAIRAANSAWNCFRSSRVWFLRSDSLRTLHSGRLNCPRSRFSKHTTASLPVSSTPHTIMVTSSAHKLLQIPLELIRGGNPQLALPTGEDTHVQAIATQAGYPLPEEIWQGNRFGREIAGVFGVVSSKF